MKSNGELLERMELTESTALTAAVIHLAIPRVEMRSVMPLAIEELLAVISQDNQMPVGPMFAHHLTLSDERFDLEVGFPVKAPISLNGRVKPGSLPATRVLRAMYRGDYEGLYRAWEEFGKRLDAEFRQVLRAEGLRPGPSIWESYTLGPETNPDPSTWRTELNQPLIKT